MAGPKAAGTAGGSPQHTPNPVEEQRTGLEKLRAPFDESLVQALPKVTCRACTQAPDRHCRQHPLERCGRCGNYMTTAHIDLSYVGHAELTARLLEADLLWDWEPLALDEQGLPCFDRNNGLWIRLTVCGHTRLGYGDAQGKTGPNAIKEAIGDALRNAAMRFGAALDLWAKSDLHPVIEPEPTPGEKLTAQLRDGLVWNNPTALRSLLQEAIDAGEDGYEPGNDGSLTDIINRQLAALEKAAAEQRERRAQQRPAAAAQVAAEHGSPPVRPDFAAFVKRVEHGWHNAAATEMAVAEASAKGWLQEQMPGPDGQLYQVEALLRARLAELLSLPQPDRGAVYAAAEIGPQQQGVA